MSLPEGITSRLLSTDGAILFESGKRWLHPLFELADFLAAQGLPGSPLGQPKAPEGSVLVDRIIGRAAAFIVVRLGIRRVCAELGSQRAASLLRSWGIVFEFDRSVEQLECVTEDLLAEVEDPDKAWRILGLRRDAARQKALNF